VLRVVRGPRAAAPAAQRRAAASADCADEDASYLRIIALLREQRVEEARMGAADYLRRCPAGFRRAEVERISHLP
jgi:hypothetical protein